MAIVQTLPVPIEQVSDADAHLLPAARSPSSSSQSTMGSVSSLISGRPYSDKQCKASEFSAKSRKPAHVPSIFRQQDGLLKNGYSQDPLFHGLPTKKPSSGLAGSGNFTYVTDDPNGDWSENRSPSSPCSDSEEVRDERTLNGNIRGPPPKLIPVSGKLEKNMEKNLIRPTAFKPVVPKNRNSSLQYLAPRAGGSGLSESQSSLNLLFSGNPQWGPEKRNSFSCRNSSNSGTMSDSGRNSLSSLPTCSTGCSQQLEPVSASMGHISLDGHGKANGFGDRGSRGPAGGLSNSDSGRSSSSKSTGSLNGRGHPLSDSGSCGRSPVTSDDIIVRELEEKLREKEAELLQLRESLDENEAAICQVYEEKQKRYEQEMEEVRQSCTSKVKQASQKSQRAQQVLQLQVFQLQQEKKKLQEDFAQLLQERETLERKCTSIQREQTELGPRLEETKWEVCQKSGEISLLKQQLKDSQVELAQKGNEILSLKAQLRGVRAELQACEDQLQELQEAAHTKTLELEVCENELQRKKNEADLLREKVGKLEREVAGLREMVARSRQSQEQEDAFLLYESDEAKAQRQNADTLLGLRQQVERLKAELLYERRRSEDQLEGFEEERRTWHEEKEKVIRYQKQLQHNYIQMYRQNRELEREMRQLNLELEARDIDDFDIQSAEIRFEEITATEI
ncbi:leucine zipper putative tumor suppressor 2a [Latimeria chalumnae]|uniref:Leucine zipper putative tumor suppressor 2 homolog n=1 Tax=Latimeria chalumnae TaxID=7897 RepID=H3A1M8_LATCH|nr:PREDICTED: leucine zipper putative tumor suppressor 2 [Latimeria chalumnae]XP_014354027.1 PREDICTED: leucine zipper putative tumor suppressor 2 [Latimeria chalumnae]|eukprot:XP_006012433.1 PREDICTED: leucine zipper putative tumor suppressor 2 [Latimeria chalumnae]